MTWFAQNEINSAADRGPGRTESLQMGPLGTGEEWQIHTECVHVQTRGGAGSWVEMRDQGPGGYDRR